MYECVECSDCHSKSYNYVLRECQNGIHSAALVTYPGVSTAHLDGTGALQGVEA